MGMFEPEGLRSKSIRSMVGVVPSNSHPYTPTESQLISSTVIRRRFIGLFAAIKDSQVREDRLNQNIDL